MSSIDKYIKQQKIQYEKEGTELGKYIPIIKYDVDQEYFPAYKRARLHIKTICRLRKNSKPKHTNIYLTPTVKDIEYNMSKIRLTCRIDGNIGKNGENFTLRIVQMEIIQC